MSSTIDLFNIYVIVFHVEHYKELIDYLLHENGKMNLTAIRSVDGVREKHVEDSLVLSGYLKKHFSAVSSVIDLGTGAGFPGLILAMEDSSLNVTMVDSTKKKIRFVGSVIDKFVIPNAQAKWGRAEVFAVEEMGRFDAVCARAMCRLDILMEYASPLLPVGGFLFAMKSSNMSEEEMILARSVQEKTGLSFFSEKIYSCSGQCRKIVTLKKENKGTQALPRHEGLAMSKPLSGVGLKRKEVG